MNIQEFKEKLNHLNDMLSSPDILEGVANIKETFFNAFKQKKLKM